MRTTRAAKRIALLDSSRTPWAVRHAQNSIKYMAHEKHTDIAPIKRQPKAGAQHFQPGLLARMDKVVRLRDEASCNTIAATMAHQQELLRLLGAWSR